LESFEAKGENAEMAMHINSVLVQFRRAAREIAATDLRIRRPK
jgi:hypothetical protein